MDVLFAFLLTLFAGLATGVGTIFAFNKRINKETLLSFALGLSAGVMIYVSFVEIFPKAFESLNQSYETNTALLTNNYLFLCGELV